MKPDRLIGKCFVIFGKDRIWNYQGQVTTALDGQYYLVRFFDAALGYPSTSAIFHISEMIFRPGRPEGAWEFFEDDAHLREWIDGRT